MRTESDIKQNSLINVSQQIPSVSADLQAGCDMSNLRSMFFVVGFLVYLISQGAAEPCFLAAKGSPTFPANFSFGVATAAYQIEGGWNADGKGPSIWDDFTHKNPDKIRDKSSGDVAADSYHRFDQDLQALKELKVDHYRFSIAWSRIYPTGDISSKNQKGIDYYNNVIDKLIANRIEPVVTMFHYDLPSEVQKIGGFANSLLVNQFVVYAIELFENYGDRVKTWITFNEPYDYCQNGYGDASYPPQVYAPGVADYLCIDNTLKAHAATYHSYKSRFAKTQGGRLGITLDSRFFFSRTNDEDIVDRGMQYGLGILAHPIFSKSGGYPDIMIMDIGANSQKEGRIRSRLPSFKNKWRDIVRGSADFLGLNYYSSRYIKRASKPNGVSPSWERDMDCDTSIDSNWLRAKSDWLYCVPEGLEGILKFIRDEYDNVEVMITENGWSDDGELIDDNRIRYLRSHLQAVLNAINDGCKISAYTHWSLIDNFEWLKGYTEKFGLYAVNMSSPNRERTAKKSAGYYKQIIESRKIPSIF
ncbi:myrosinase 1-like [Episyrphus balteatus]|uniref:myrosinase 1-like n=1 Tax=Episyrphus balteatus TaxID=286459 RepID=UPI0024860824|nr:myrosinase 1-like [Episyrphus balteatus]